MRRAIVGFVVALLAAAGVMVAGPAQAVLNGSGYCDYGPGDAYGFVREFPQEGDLSYVVLDANHQLNVSLTTDRPYYNGGSTLITTGHFAADPIDGDGLWNYRDNWNWDATGTYGQVTRVVIYVQRAGTSDHCSFTVNI